MEVYARVRRAVQVDGMSIRGAAREFGLSRKTVKGGVKVSHQGGAKGDHFCHCVARCSLALGAAGAEPCDAR